MPPALLLLLLLKNGEEAKGLAAGALRKCFEMGDGSIEGVAGSHGSICRWMDSSKAYIMNIEYMWHKKIHENIRNIRVNHG